LKRLTWTKTAFMIEWIFLIRHGQERKTEMVQIEEAESLEPGVFTAALRSKVFGTVYHHEKETGSTNAVIRHLAEKGAPEGTLVIAESQSLGRGRRGRSWVSPPGGIWLSLLLRPGIDPHGASLQALVAAVALKEALWQTEKVSAAIKWPNDLLWGEKKIAGILAEMKAMTGQLDYLIVGVGINANFPADCLPEALQGNATTLLEILKRPVHRQLLVASFLATWEKHYFSALQEGYAGVLELWRSYSNTLGRDVGLQSGGRQVTGRALDIDEKGRLVVETAPGLREAFLAGEVTLQKG
jgi:BirA family transcriptional regulator, biotin operon repressor / biotin---[acetyl-CoA-carboxylase] ligase